MASKGTKEPRASSPQIFDCESLPIPPGTMNRARLPRGLELETSARRIGWLLGGVAVGALLVGVLIGRFLLP